MKVLTDTHTLVWALTDPSLLSRKARKAVTEFEVTPALLICGLKKNKQGGLLADPLVWWEKYVSANSIPTLSIRTAHMMTLGTLGDFHRDPFDRILVAQSKTENLVLVSKDAALSRYGISLIW